MSQQQKQISVVAEARIAKVLGELGINFEDQNFKDTPRRWLKFIMEFCQEYDPVEDLSKTFDEPVTNVYHHGIIVQSNIPYQAVCAHHLVPVLGRAHVAYLPDQKVVGLSKLTRLVWGYCHASPSLQEDVGNEVVDAIMKLLGAKGAMCVISAEHGCMACRGVAQQDIQTVTSSIRGLFIDDKDVRREVYDIIKIGGTRNHG